MELLALLAELPRQTNDPMRRPEVIWGTVALAGALLAGATVIFLVDRWRKQNEKVAGPSAAELTGFRGMYERGEITEEEYAKLRERVAQRVKTPPKSTAGPNPPASTNADAGPRLNLPGLIDWEADDAEERTGNANPQHKLPGPETQTPPPESGKPANPPPPA